MKNIAIFASGSGTNAENITRYFANSENVNVAVVLSNNRNVGVHGRVNKLGVPSFVFSRDEFAAGTPILEKLAEYDVCFIVLAGFMNKISDVILQAFPGKIVNIHPALLPKYGGKGMYGMPHRNGAVRPVLRVIRSGKLSPPGSLPVFSCGFYRYSMWVHIPLWPDCPTWPSPPGPRGQTAQETALESIARSEG